MPKFYPGQFVRLKREHKGHCRDWNNLTMSGIYKVLKVGRGTIVIDERDVRGAQCWDDYGFQPASRKPEGPNG